MSTTVFECIQNAHINFRHLGDMGLSNHPIYQIAMDQLNNAVEALDNDMGLHDVIQESAFGEVDTGGGK